MGKVESMLLHYCSNAGWTEDDHRTRMRCINRHQKNDHDYNPSQLVSDSVWRAFGTRHPVYMRRAATWSRTVAQILGRIDAMNALDAIDVIL